MAKPGLNPLIASGLLAFSFVFSLGAAEVDPPAVTGLSLRNAKPHVSFLPHPGAKRYTIQSAPDLGAPFTDTAGGVVDGFSWDGPTPVGPRAFYRLKVESLSNDELGTANLLNRIGYGPSPDELDRVRALGVRGYIAEQLAWENIQETLSIDQAPAAADGWRYVTMTGTGSASVLYMYLNAPGIGYIDDVKLVEGTVAEVGVNLLRNGDFERPLSTNDWVVSENHTGSAIVSDTKHSGNGALRMTAATVPSAPSRDTSIFQNITPALVATRQYTLSFWFLPAGAPKSTVTVRLSGNGVLASTSPPIFGRLTDGTASIEDLRSWHVQRAIQSRRQLLEVLLQFFENHFVTEYTKTRDYFDRHYDDPQRSQVATQLEFKEIQRWRAALMKPNCTFHDLLKISAESPSMIIYLDTVDSRGDGNNIANENYARELLELFTFGVDNGYDQNDIVEVSKTWTGWRVNIVDLGQESNPFAARTVNTLDGTTNRVVANLLGSWVFTYESGRHNNGAKTIFPSKTVPDRFGPPWAGRPYELRIAATTRGTNTIQEGYTVLRHLADLPFTQEFLAVKLCRLLVHEDFEVGYDFTLPELTPEAKLVRDCMLAWENGNPKGQIRSVLEVILNSDLFLSHGGSMQKVKTPLEFVVSALRALRVDLGAGRSTVTTDGNIHSILTRMGAMRLFDRAEPDGYPEAAAPWVSAGTLAERLRFVQSFLLATGSRGGATDAGSSSVDPVALIKAKLPAASWNNAEALADYFLGILYPAEGTANLALYKKSAVTFLNTGDDGIAASLLTSLDSNSTAYDTRIRGMVAMLLTLPRFQEQ